MKTIYENIVKVISSSEKAALCTVISTRGSTPLKAGAKMIVWDNGKISGTVGGGSLEKRVIEDAVKICRNGQAQVFTHELLHQHRMCCGGTVDVFIERIPNQPQLYIFGAGHVGKALSGYAKDIGFGVTLIDERKEIFQDKTWENITVVNTPHYDFLSLAKFDSNTFIVICTHIHAYDREILAYCIKQPSAYLGMIGSIRKVKVTRKMFMASGTVTDEELEKVDMPIGFDIGGTTPGEIAVSIMAKLIAVKNNRTVTEGKTILETLNLL